MEQEEILNFYKDLKTKEFVKEAYMEGLGKLYVSYRNIDELYSDNLEYFSKGFLTNYLLSLEN